MATVRVREGAGSCSHAVHHLQKRSQLQTQAATWRTRSQAPSLWPRPMRRHQRPGLMQACWASALPPQLPPRTHRDGVDSWWQVTCHALQQATCSTSSFASAPARSPALVRENTPTVLCSRQLLLERPCPSAPCLGLQYATLKVLVSLGAGSVNHPRSAAAATDMESQLGQRATAQARAEGPMGEAAGEQTAMH